MVFSGIWLVIAMADADVERLRPQVDPHLAAAAQDRETARRLHRWSAAPERVRGRRPTPHPDSNRLELDEDSADFGLMFTHPLAQTPLMREWQAAAKPEIAMFSMTRRCFPLTALFHGIGPHRAAMLPGFQGNFLLTSARVRAALPAVRAALAFDAPERAAVEHRMSDWLTTVGDSDDNPADIIDGPPRIFAEAADRRLGLCGITCADSWL